MQDIYIICPHRLNSVQLSTQIKYYNLPFVINLGYRLGKIKEDPGGLYLPGPAGLKNLPNFLTISKYCILPSVIDFAMLGIFLIFLVVIQNVKKSKSQ